MPGVEQVCGGDGQKGRKGRRGKRREEEVKCKVWEEGKHIGRDLKGREEMLRI